jgi:nicotinamide-nucleotide amidase
MALEPTQAHQPRWADVLAAAQALRAPLRERGWMLGCAESCTGGLVASAITSFAGSSDWFERGFVTYSNRAKTELLGVPAALLAEHGAVSREVALAMARGVLAHAPVQAALAVTGIAGPSGGTPDKPVGLVWFGWAWRDGRQPDGVRADAEAITWPGNREAVRLASARYTLEGLRQHLEQAGKA